MQLCHKRKHKKKHNLNWPQNSWSSISNISKWRPWIRKTNALLNLIDHEPDIDTFYIYAKDPYETKYQLLISEGGSTGWKYLNDLKAFIEYSNAMDDFYKKMKNIIQIK